MKGKGNQITEIINETALDYNVKKAYLISKRVLDIIGASVGLIILIPVFFITAIAIKCSSQGTVLFCQNRCGYNGKIFKIYKFRSMVKNAESMSSELSSMNEVNGPMFKMRNDPRVTKVGRFIRKTSIDELPQLINVLKGDMSLVGPRPPLITEVNFYGSWHNLRMSVKPGMTGLWQISGRNDIGFDDMVRLDLKYIRERNFWYDLKIIFRTLPLLFGDKRAA